MSTELQRSQSKSSLHLQEDDDKDPKENTITLQSFNDRLKVIKLLLWFSGYHYKTKASYQWFLRLVTWGCTVLCILNLIFRTRAYRNPLFDVTLSYLHIWVSVSYEVWSRFLKTQHWKFLLKSMSSMTFFTKLSTLGYIGFVVVWAASCNIFLGWMAPILESFFDSVNWGNSSSMHQGIFLAFHGFLMIVIVVPWASVAVCSMLLFYLVIEAHKADIDGYFRFIQSKNPSPLCASLNLCLAQYKPLRERLETSCRDFQHLYSTFVVLFFLLIMASANNINLYILYPGTLEVFKVFQDALYMLLGVVGLYCGLWATCSLKDYWVSFLQKVIDFPTDFFTPRCRSMAVTHVSSSTDSKTDESSLVQLAVLPQATASRNSSQLNAANTNSDPPSLHIPHDSVNNNNNTNTNTTNNNNTSNYNNNVIVPDVLTLFQFLALCRFGFSVYGFIFDKKTVVFLSGVFVQSLLILLYVLNDCTHD